MVRWLARRERSDEFTALLPVDRCRSHCCNTTPRLDELNPCSRSPSSTFQVARRSPATRGWSCWCSQCQRLEPRRPAAGVRLGRQHVEGVGCPERCLPAHTPRTSKLGEVVRLEPRRPAAGVRLLRQHVEGVGCPERCLPAHTPRTSKRGDVVRLEPRRPAAGVRLSRQNVEGVGCPERCLPVHTPRTSKL